MFNDVKELISYIESLRRNEKKENLDYMHKLCSLFANPERKKKFIHIGGTNGKGSTVTYVCEILLRAGYHVGTYISPYIVCFNERITFDGKYISDQNILKYANLIIEKFPLLESLNMRHPSFFEFVTLLAFLYFAAQKDLDFAIIEVGIGGLLDCTNVINPLVSAITNVSYDHMNILGNTLAEIWTNKLGIVKENTPFVTLKDEENLAQIRNTCHIKNAALTLVDPKMVYNVTIDFKKTQFSYQDYVNITLKMLGAYQIENALIAINIIEIIKKEFPISIESIYQGFLNSKWPGRLEVINEKPLIILDGAHNIDAIKRLSEFIEMVKNNQYVRLIFAVSSNKEKEEMIAIIEPFVDEIIFTHFSYKRSDEAQNLYHLSHHQKKQVIDDLDEIINLSYQEKNIINIFCGSLFFVSELRAKLLK